MSVGVYPSINDREFDILKKLATNTALLADSEAGDVASILGTANQITVSQPTGAVTLSLPSTVITTRFEGGSGTAAAPSFSFSTDTAKGFYRRDADSIGIAIHGVLDGILYSPSAGELQVINGNANGTLRIDANGAIYLTSSGTNKSITLTPSGTGQVLNIDGVAATPSYSFTSQGGLGFYRYANNNIGVSIGGLAYGLIGGDTGSGFFYIGGPAGSGAASFYTNGATKIVSGGTNQNITLTPSGSGLVNILTANGVAPILSLEQTSQVRWRVGVLAGNSYLRFDASSDALAGPSMQLCTNSHLLLGGLAVDGTGVLQFPAGAADKTSGISLGTDSFIYRSSSGQFCFDYTSSDPVLNLRTNGSTNCRIRTSSNGILFDTNGTTTALTLSSAQKATFAGDLTTSTSRTKHVKVVTATYTQDTTSADEVIVGNHATVAFTITLLSAASTTGRSIVIKNRGAATVTVAAAAAASEIFSTSAVASVALTTGQSITIISDGTYWNVC